MKYDLDVIDELLTRWHHWCNTLGDELELPKVVSACAMWSCGRNYDWQNGVQDAKIHETQMEAVHFAVEGMAHPWNAAVHERAKNLTMRPGARVFRSPRLPEGDAERGEVIAQAMEMLGGRLAAEGVI